MLETAKKTMSQVFISSNNGSGVYLLFVDKKPPSEHDLLVTDFVGSFSNVEDAMKWYDSMYLPYGEPQAVIAKFDGTILSVRYRAIVLGEEDHIPGHPAWTYAYDAEEDY